MNSIDLCCHWVEWKYTEMKNNHTYTFIYQHGKVKYTWHGFQCLLLLYESVRELRKMHDIAIIVHKIIWLSLLWEMAWNLFRFPEKLRKNHTLHVCFINDPYQERDCERLRQVDSTQAGVVQWLWSSVWKWKVKDWVNFSLTHWGRVMHICVGNLTIIGSDNGLSPGRHQAII